MATCDLGGKESAWEVHGNFSQTVRAGVPAHLKCFRLKETGLF